MSECVLWTGARFTDGYGRLGSRRAHRVAWEARYGPIPAGLVVCHHCDTPLCVRVSHLFLGTPGDNNRDSMLKGRRAKGEAVNTAKLTEAQVREIRRLYEPAAVRGQHLGRTSNREIARRYGVSDAMISYILRGTSWRHVR